MELPRQIHEAMIAHARFTFPEEACGLLAADEDNRLRMAYCLTNVERSPAVYTVDPTEHFRSLQHAERNGWRLAGVFHSHPHSDPYPSPTDVAKALEPDWVYVLVSLKDQEEPDVRAFHIRNGDISEEPLLVTDH
ncbi:MAG: Mov34/MPN/PAD-1 family protein [Acidimicrobiia bacterium]